MAYIVKYRWIGSARRALLFFITLLTYSHNDGIVLLTYVDKKETAMYSDKVIEHFMCPQNAYTMPDANGVGEVGDPSCGDCLTMWIKVEEDILKEVSYLVFGCPASIATSSMTSVLAKGITVNKAKHICEKDIVDALGGLPEAKQHCSNLGVSALRKAIKDYERMKMKRLFGIF